jgi:hypothetical protein
MDDGSRLKSVNWTTGMLLSPDHFRRQDAFLEETVGWLLQYCLPGTGLVGAGIRIAPGERGLARFDPRVEVSDDGETVSVSVLEARGLTALGQLVDISQGNTVRASVRKQDLFGLSELQVYVVHGGGREEDPASIGVDDSNPTQAAYRRAQYTVRLGSDADTLPHALCVARIRRLSESLQFEIDSRFIPQCATMLGHSQLYADWKRLHGAVVTMASQYSELHRQCAQYVALIAQRGADVSHDRDILAFIERAVLGLDHCAYESFEATITPDAFFREVERAGRRVALALDLSESTRLYFAELGQADASYGNLLEEERDALTRPRELGSRADLQVAVSRANGTLERMRRLGDALEARYIDYRLSRSIESLRFLLDGEGEQFFLSVATPGHPQRDLETLTFVFSQLNLASRQRYRLVFLADAQAQPWQPGESFRVDVRLNPGSYDGRPQSKELMCALPGQRNFAFDFEPEAAIASLSALQVTVQPGIRIRGCILYQRRLGVQGRASMMVSAPPTPDVVGARQAPPPMQQQPPQPPPGQTSGTATKPRVVLRRDKP